MNRKKELFFWSISAGLLLLFFTIKGTNLIQSFYFLISLLPVVIVTSYFFNEFLVPKYLKTQKYFHCAVYTLYTIIVSFYLELLLVYLSVYIFQLYNIEGENILTVDLINMSLFIYLVTLIRSFIHLFEHYNQQKTMIQDLKQEIKQNQKLKLNIMVNRKMHSILLDDLIYLESMDDQLKFVSKSKTLVSRNKISHIQKELPSNFIRVHRSFIINMDKSDRYSKEQIFTQDATIPISRTYKTETMEALKK